MIEQLRSSYVDSSALTNQEINQAAVEGLLSRLGPGASLQTKTQTAQPAPNRPFKSDLIQTQFGYVRLGSFTQNGLPQLDETLNNFRSRGVTGLILDLRTMQPASDFQLAADILSRFVPKGKALFNLMEPKGGAAQDFISSADPAFAGPLAVLVSQDNAGTAEAIAGTLREQLHALIIGQKTSGRAVEYEHYPIGDELVLTVATKELVIPARPLFSQTDLRLTSQCHSQSNSTMPSLRSQTRTVFRITFLTKNGRTPTRRLWSRGKTLIWTRTKRTTPMENRSNNISKTWFCSGQLIF